MQSPPDQLAANGQGRRHSYVLTWPRDHQGFPVSRGDFNCTRMRKMKILSGSLRVELNHPGQQRGIAKVVEQRNTDP